jgi:hypothetical protein
MRRGASARTVEQLRIPTKETTMIEGTKTRTALAMLLATAIAAPSAGAHPADSPLPARAASDTAHPLVEAHANGFDWGDAGIGAAGTLSILGLGAGAVVVARRDRGQRTVG